MSFTQRRCWLRHFCCLCGCPLIAIMWSMLACAGACDSRDDQAFLQVHCQRYSYAGTYVIRLRSTALPIPLFVHVQDLGNTDIISLTPCFGTFLWHTCHLGSHVATLHDATNDRGLVHRRRAIACKSHQFAMFWSSLILLMRCHAL